MHLPAISNQNNLFSLLGLDQIVAIADHFGLSLQRTDDAVSLDMIIKKMMEAYSESMTGVVLAPEFGYDALYSKAEKPGVIFPLERRLYDADPLSIPILTSQWGVEAIANNYGVAKLELFYNPEEKEAATKKQMVAEIFEYCQQEKIDFILELVLFIEGTELDYKAQFPELQLTAIQELRTLCSCIALEYPLNALGAVTVTAELDIPWILTGRETSYDVFKEQLRTALESGAQGFLAMEQFLPEKPATGNTTFDQEKALQFITTTGRDRALELSRIVSENQPL